MLGLMLIVQAVIVPAVSPSASSLVAPAAERLTLVIADTVDQTDPHPLCPEPNCTSMFLGRFENGRVLAGPSLAPAFSARLEMGSPFISRYRLALIIEQRPGAEPVVHATSGFNDTTREACFELTDTRRLGWTPVGRGITASNGVLCVTE